MKDQLEALVVQMYKSGILYSEAVREDTRRPPRSAHAPVAMEKKAAGK